MNRLRRFSQVEIAIWTDTFGAVYARRMEQLTAGEDLKK